MDWRLEGRPERRARDLAVGGEVFQKATAFPVREGDADKDGRPARAHRAVHGVRMFRPVWGPRR